MKNILITGGSGGLGRSVALHLAEHGCRVFSCDISASPSPHGGITEFIMDVRDSASIQRVFEEITRQAGSLDALIHLAGVYAMDSFVEIGEDVLTRLLDINLLGVYRVNKIFLPLLRDHGRIVIVTSEVAVLDPLPFNGIYSLSKTALECYAHSLRLELSMLDIPVITVRPGAFQTGLLDSSHSSMRSMCEKTRLYRVNTARFRRIMEKETGTAKDPAALAPLISRIIDARSPRPVYSINTSMRLRLLSSLPIRAQVWVIRRLLR